MRTNEASPYAPRAAMLRIPRAASPTITADPATAGAVTLRRTCSGDPRRHGRIGPTPIRNNNNRKNGMVVSLK